MPLPQLGRANRRNGLLAIERDVNPKKDFVLLPAPLDLTPYLGEKLKNRIKHIGVELEGGWKAVPDGIRLERDGSVFKKPDNPAEDDRMYGRASHPGIFFGEIPMGRMQPASLLPLLKKYYPDMINETCGLHCHMSFRNVFLYSILCVPEYVSTVIHYLRLWAKEEGLPADHVFWPRLEGKNIYCQHVFWPEAQIERQGKDHNQQRYGHRYTFIHYCWRNGTIECRGIPMFDDYKQGARAIQRLLDVTNACLVALAKSDALTRQMKAVLELPEDEAVHEHVVEIV